MFKIGSFVKVYSENQDFFIGKIDIINYNSEIMFVLDEKGNSHIADFDQVDPV